MQIYKNKKRFQCLLLCYTIFQIESSRYASLRHLPVHVHMWLNIIDFMIRHSFPGQVLCKNLLTGNESAFLHFNSDYYGHTCNTSIHVLIYSFSHFNFGVGAHDSCDSCFFLTCRHSMMNSVFPALFSNCSGPQRPPLIVA